MAVVVEEESLFHQAVETLGGEAKAKDWLTRPNAEFHGEPPVLWLGSIEGCRLVQAALDRQRHSPLR